MAWSGCACSGASSSASLASIETTVQLQDFDFTLPPELIAQAPAARRDQARLMVVDRARQRVTHDTFANIGKYLRTGDTLVVNDTKVIPARLHGRKVGTGGKVEVKELVWLEIHLTDQQTINFWAEVVDEATEIGFALKFNSSSPEDEAALTNYLEGLFQSQTTKKA